MTRDRKVFTHHIMTGGILLERNFEDQGFFLDRVIVCWVASCERNGDAWNIAHVVIAVDGSRFWRNRKNLDPIVMFTFPENIQYQSRHEPRRSFARLTRSHDESCDYETSATSDRRTLWGSWRSWWLLSFATDCSISSEYWHRHTRRAHTQLQTKSHTSFMIFFTFRIIPQLWHLVQENYSVSHTREITLYRDIISFLKPLEKNVI